MRDHQTMLITFLRLPGRSTIATFRRRDGVVLELGGYDRKFRVPHDLAHAVTERELGMDRGVFGSIAGGAVFDSMRVIDGKQRHDAADRSRRILAANKTTLGIAEVLSGVVHDAVEINDPGSVSDRCRSGWGTFSTEPFPWAEDELAAACATLAELTAEMGISGKVTLAWPDRLVSPVPEPSGGPKRGRRGRV
jgi:hypothetical protein